MGITNYNMLIDLDKPSKNTILMKKGDNKSRTVTFTFISGGKTIKLGESDAVTIMAIMPDGESRVFASCDILENGKAEYTFTKNMLLNSGKITADISVSREGMSIRSFEFYINVEGLLYDDIVIPQEDVVNIGSYVARALYAAEEAERILEEIRGLVDNG